MKKTRGQKFNEELYSMYASFRKPKKSRDPKRRTGPLDIQDRLKVKKIELKKAEEAGRITLHHILTREIEYEENYAENNPKSYNLPPEENTE